MSFTRWHPPPAHRITAADETESFAIAPDGTRLYVRRRPGPATSTPAPTVLLSDGILCDGFIWKYLWDDLATLGPVAHWHYRGHGRSGTPIDADALDMSDFARDLDAVRVHLGDPEVVLAGHSMGVQVSLEGYRLRREKVAGLVLALGAPGRITHTFHGTNVLAQALPSILSWVTKHSAIARALWTRFPAELALKLSFLMKEVDVEHMRKDDLLPYLRHMTHVDFEFFVKLLRAAGEHSAEDLLPDVRVPALVIAAERDTFTPPSLAKHMAETMPRGSYVFLEGGSHAALLEQPDKVKAVIAKFLRDDVRGFLAHRRMESTPPPPSRAKRANRASK